MISTIEEQETINIVIVEDYKLTRTGLQYALKKYTDINFVGEADNGVDAVSLIERTKPNLVLLDLGIPRLNGLEVISKIKEISKSTKILILTSHDRQEEVISALGLGANAYALKDITPDTLYHVIKNVFKGACWLDPKVANCVLNTIPKPEDQGLIPSLKSNKDKISLTEREMEVLKLLVQGKSNAEIADALIVSVHTAKAHVCSILQKFCVEDRVQAAVKAITENIV